MTRNHIALTAFIFLIAACVGTCFLASSRAGDGAASSAAAPTLRIARLPAGKCSEERCPKGSIAGDGWCACLTASKASEPVAEEVKSTSELAAKDTRKMMLCGPDKDGQGGGVSYPLASDPLPIGCYEILPKVLLPGVQTNSLPTGIEAQLEVECYPCRVSPGSWGPCPHCILWPGGCARACPVVDGGMP